MTSLLSENKYNTKYTAQRKGTYQVTKNSLWERTTRKQIVRTKCWSQYKSKLDRNPSIKTPWCTAFGLTNDLSWSSEMTFPKYAILSKSIWGLLRYHYNEVSRWTLSPRKYFFITLYRYRCAFDILPLT